MVIKPADDKQPYLEALQSLSSRSDLSLDAHRRIEQDIRFMRAGARGEREAAYEIDFYYGDTAPNWVVVHDLRIEHEGRIAQIDHLLMNRFLKCFVLETKSFSEGVAVNEYGEFTQFYRGKPQGIASPLEQNAKHIAVLTALLSSNKVSLPSRLGLTLMPSITGLVVVSKTARVSRPSKGIAELDNVLKIDQLVSRLGKEVGKASLLKLVGVNTLRALAQALVAQHVKAPVPSAARYGLSKQLVSPDLQPTAVGAPLVPQEPSGPLCGGCAGPITSAERKFSLAQAGRFGGKGLCRKCQKTEFAPATAEVPPSSMLREEKVSRYACATCGAGLSFAVAKFCQMNKTRFGGEFLCRDHQG